jgi:hypothetical protein
VSTIYVLVVLSTGLMAKKVLSLPQIYIPTPQGGRKPVSARAGTTVLATLQKHGVSGLAARRGLERRDPDTGNWEKVPMSQVLKPGDTVRVRFAPQRKAGGALGALLKSLFTSAKRRERGSTRDSRRRK